MSIRATTRARLAAAVERKRLTTKEVAQRAGLDPRTIQRLLEGETWDPDTVDAVAEALGVEVTGWDEGQVVDAVRGALGSPREALHEVKLRAETRPVDSVCPVVGWKAAARVLGIGRRTLEKRRREAGDRTRRAWWASPQAVVEWYERLEAT